MIGILWNGPMAMQKSVAKWWKCFWTSSFCTDPGCKLTPGQFLRETKQLLGTFSTSTCQWQAHYLLEHVFFFRLFFLSYCPLLKSDEARFNTADWPNHSCTVCLTDKYSYPAVSLWPVKTDGETEREREKWPRGWRGDRTERNFPVLSTRVPLSLFCIFSISQCSSTHAHSILIAQL